MVVNVIVSFAISVTKNLNRESRKKEDLPSFQANRLMSDPHMDDLMHLTNSSPSSGSGMFCSTKSYPGTSLCFTKHFILEVAIIVCVSLFLLVVSLLIIYLYQKVWSKKMVVQQK